MRWRRGGWGGWGGMRRGWGGGWGGGWGYPGGFGRWGGWGMRRGFGCFPCCSLVMLLPLLAFLGVIVTLAVHYL